MFKDRVQIVAMALTVALWQPAWAEPATASAIRPPEITRVEIDAAKWRLVISGANFGDDAPAVRLGGQTLSIASASANRIVAGLPSAISPATYRLTLTDARDVSKTDSIDVQLSQLYRNTPRGR